MKTDIHPELHDVVFVDSSTGAKFISQSTTKTEETMKINGKDYHVIKVEISSDSHPFYTGKQKLLDTSGRVDKFRAKMKKAQELAEQNEKTVKDIQVGLRPPGGPTVFCFLIDDFEEIGQTREWFGDAWG